MFLLDLEQEATKELAPKMNLENFDLSSEIVGAINQYTATYPEKVIFLILNDQNQIYVISG